MVSQDSTDIEKVAIRVKSPSRVLHFSDGIIEEFSDEEVDQVNPSPELDVDEVFLLVPCSFCYIWLNL